MPIIKNEKGEIVGYEGGYKPSPPTAAPDPNVEYPLIVEKKKRVPRKSAVAKVAKEQLSEMLAGSTEAPEAESPITALIKSSGVEQSAALEVERIMKTFLKKAAEANKIIESLVVEDVNDTGIMKVARELRLTLKDSRIVLKNVVTEKRTAVKELMAPYKAIDDLWLHSFQLAEATYDTLEAKLKDTETFAQKVAQKAQEELRDKRLVELKPLLISPNGADHLPLGTMPEEEYQKLLHTYQTLAAEREAKEKKEAEQRKQQEEIEKKKLLQRVAMLPEATWDGNNVTYKGKVLVSLNGLTTLSDYAFEAIVQAHAGQLEEDKKDNIEAKVQRRYDRLGNMGLTYNDQDGFFHLNGKKEVHWEKIANFTDEEFDTWVDSFKKDVEAKSKRIQEEQEAVIKQQKLDAQRLADEIFNARLKELMGLGLIADGTTLRHKTVSVIDFATLRTIKSDEDFQKIFNECKAYVETKKQESPDAEKIDRLLVLFHHILESLPVTQSDQAKRIIAGTRTLTGKIVKWIEAEKEKI